MIRGVVIRGEGRGRELGFPTANLDCKRSSVQLEPGIYAAWAHFEGKKYMSGLVIMTAPWKVEAHMIGYIGDDIYGKYLEVDPIQRVSSLRHYGYDDWLRKKIREDLQLVRDVLEGNG